MHALRTSPLLTRLVLAWFVLMLGAAGASPLVQPTAMEVVCSAAGNVKVVVLGDDGLPAPTAQHTLDCSLCLSGAAPLPLPTSAVVPVPQPLAQAVERVAAARIAPRTGAPLPARGPPPLA